MADTTRTVQQWVDQWSDKPYAYLTTTGRRTGKPHRIEIWFAVDKARIFMLAGGRDRSDWVRNLKVNPQVTVELGVEKRPGVARILQEGTNEDTLARDLLVAKYARPEDSLADWKRRSLAIAIEFSVGTSETPDGDREPAGN